jgi:uncharacterized membrane protein YcaP (DUF421 family)
LAFKNEKIEHISQGVLSLLIKDGIIDLKELKKNHITKQQVFAMLREKGIQNLGNVKRAYLEACGIFSVYKTDDNQPGLSIFPASDKEIKNIQKEVPDYMMACSNCGHVQNIKNDTATCEICQTKNWSKAYLQLN